MNDLRPQWEWRFDAADGTRLDRPVSPVFSTQFDAELWLGERWRALAEQRVVVAQLLHRGAAAAAPVTLSATR